MDDIKLDVAAVFACGCDSATITGADFMQLEYQFADCGIPIVLVVNMNAEIDNYYAQRAYEIGLLHEVWRVPDVTESIKNLSGEML